MVTYYSITGIIQTERCSSVYSILWPLDQIAQHMINKQTAIYNAMNKMIYRTTIKLKWRKF